MSFAEQDSYKTEDAGTNCGTTRWRFQTFVADASYNVTRITMKMHKSAGDTVGTITVGIRAVDVSHQPTGNDLTSGTYDGDTITGTTWANRETLNFDVTSYGLTLGTEYAFVVRATGATGVTSLAPSCDSSGGFTEGTFGYSSNSGSSWITSAGTDMYFITYSGAESVTPTDKTHTTYLVTAADDKIFYGTSSSGMTQLSAADNEIDCSEIVTMAPAYQKVFIANGTNLKVIDFGNVKLTTADIGSNAPDRGNILTGGTSGAAGYADYITATSGACTLYVNRTTTATFSSGETVTGTDDDGYAISFVLSAAETTGPHWYSWAVYGADTTNNGTLPTKTYLVCRYFGRVIVVDHYSGFAWKATRVENPFDLLYDSDDPLSGYASGSGDAGEIGDVIRCLIPFGDDFLVFGCANSIYALFGDPGSAGQINELTNETGIYSPFAWCKDNAGNLYFLGSNGLYKMMNGTSKPENFSIMKLPALMDDWALAPATHRVILVYDPIRHGIKITRTTISSGANISYWYSLKTEGFYPESHPDECGIFSAVYFDCATAADKTVVYGTYDGYLREELNTAKDDDAGASGDTAINSYMVLPIAAMGEDKDHEGKLQWIIGELGGGASSGDFSDSDGATWEVHVGDDAETVLEDIRDGSTAFTSGTWTGTGRQTKVRTKARGAWVGVKIYNSTAAQTWVLNNLYGDIIPKGRI